MKTNEEYLERMVSTELNFEGIIFIKEAEALKALELMRGEMGWISVDDRLPKDNELVLTFQGADKSMRKDFQQLVLWYDESHLVFRGWKEDHEDMPRDSAGMYLDVTHWRPLPQPPNTSLGELTQEKGEL